MARNCARMLKLAGDIGCIQLRSGQFVHFPAYFDQAGRLKLNEGHDIVLSLQSKKFTSSETLPDSCSLQSSILIQAPHLHSFQDAAFDVS